MNNKFKDVLKTNVQFLKEKIDQMEKFDAEKIRSLFDAFHMGLFTMAITNYITRDEANFALEQGANCLSYLVKEKFGVDLQIIKM